MNCLPGLLLALSVGAEAPSSGTVVSENPATATSAATDMLLLQELAACENEPTCARLIEITTIALRGAREEDRMAAVDLLRRTHDSGAVQELAYLLRFGDPLIAEAAASALADRDEDEARAMLRQARDDADPRIGELARSALKRTKGLDPDVTRVVLSRTAYTRDAGDFGWRWFYLENWQFEYGLNDHWEIGAWTMVYPLLLMGTVKLGYPIGEKTRLGFLGTAGMVLPYSFDETPMFVGGGGPMLTLGGRHLFFNVGVQLMADTFETVETMASVPAGSYSSSTRTVTHPANATFWPNLSTHLQLGDYVALTIDALAMFGVRAGTQFFGLAFCGTRIFGNWVYGDVGLLNLVVSNGGSGADFSYYPLPYLGFGFVW